MLWSLLLLLLRESPRFSFTFPSLLNVHVGSRHIEPVLEYHIRHSRHNAKGIFRLEQEGSMPMDRRGHVRRRTVSSKR